MRCSALISLLCLSTQLSGCAIGYYWQALSGQLELLGKRVPIDTVIEKEGKTSELATKLSEVVAMRRFAVDELGLPDNGSYESYVDLKRPYVVWNVIAAKEFSIAPKRWCYPFVGCVSYRGFFTRERAERFASRLSDRHLDTYVGGATAYSTLGFFADPVLSTMLEGGQAYVAEILFHELTHQRLYIKSDSAFSEAFATAVGEYGTERWLEERGETAAAERYREQLRYRTDFAALVARTQQRLGVLYASAEAPEAKRAAKKQLYGEMRDEYARLKTDWGGYSGYDAWFAAPLNNAKLAAVATYRRWVPGLRWVLDRQGLETFFATMNGLAKLSDEARAAQLEAWLEQAVSAQPSAANARARADAALRADKSVTVPATSGP